jgi:TonB family protein
VLSAGADPRSYGSLLLEVGRRRSSSSLMMATFAEPRLFLEERIRRIARHPLRRSRGRSAAFAIVALLLFTTALSARDPLRPAPAGGGIDLLPRDHAASAVAAPHDILDENGDPVSFGLAPIDVSAGVGPMAIDTPPAPPRVEAQPTFTPMTERPELRNVGEVQEALRSAYPPVLRDAGVRGTPTVWFFIDDEGVVRRTQLSRPSGYPALDEAALRVAPVMRFSPARNRGEPVSVWVEIPIAFGEPPVPPAAAAPLRPAVQQQGELVNRTEVQQALERAYPPMLRDAGIGGAVVVWYFVDENGRVLRTQIGAASGRAELDEAALSVASIMRFAPYRRDGAATQVWMEVPIVFGGSRVPLTRGGGELVPVSPIVVSPGAADDATVRPARVPLVRTPVPPELAELARQPTFTPMTQRPELQNQSEVQRALVRHYPPLLRDAGIGGQSVIWFLIDDEGRVVTTQISRPSAHPALDEAALAIASVMQFSPGRNRDQRVPVWVEIPIVFTAR